MSFGSVFAKGIPLRQWGPFPLPTAFTLESVLVSHDPFQNLAVDFVEGVVCGSEHGVVSGLAEFVQQTRGRGSSLGFIQRQC